MAAKVSKEVLARIIKLKLEDHLSNVMVGKRLDLSPKTVRLYLKAAGVTLPSDWSPYESS